MQLDNLAIMRYLVSHKDLSEGEKLVALAILGHRDSQTLRCDPSQETIAGIVNIDRNTVKGIVKRLVKKGVVETVQVYRHGSSSGRTHSQYFFLLDLFQARVIADLPGFGGDRDDLFCAELKVRNKAEGRYGDAVLRKRAEELGIEYRGDDDFRPED